MEQVNRTLAQLSRVVVGAVFIFSGFVKAVDPAGFIIKLQDYFTAWGLEFLHPLALVLTLSLISLEFLIGFGLFLNIRIRESSLGALVFMILFTPLTLYLAIFNPVTDCGCFGDALVLTNWQTFWKNIFIDIFVVIIYINRKRYIPAFPMVYELGISVFLFAIVFYLQVFSLNHLPVLDFRPFHTGSHIPSQMVIPPNAEQPEYETILIYEKDGKQQEFTLEDYPWQDSTWTWVETQTELIKEGYEPPIHNFNIFNLQGEEVTDEILNNNHPVLLVIAPDLDKASNKAISLSNELYPAAVQNNIAYYFITASTESTIEKLRDQLYFDFPIYLCDETELKTAIRSNPGLILLMEGTVIKKWHHRDFPKPDELSETMVSDAVNDMRKSLEFYVTVALALAVFLTLTLIYQWART